MIKNIIFDIGNVLFGYEPTYILNQILPENKFHSDYLTHFIQADCWQQLDRGTLDESALVDILANKIDDPNLEDHLQLIIQNFVYHLHLINGSRELFLTLKNLFTSSIASCIVVPPF